MWKSIVIHDYVTIRKAVEILNETPLRIVLVVDSNEDFVGTITDGDVRRGLLRGLDLDDVIEGIINSRAIVVPIDSKSDEIKRLMKLHRVHQVPIVDEQKRVVGLHIRDENTFPNQRANTMVIMAGGKGTRLYPKTLNCPKPLLLIAGKPILEHIINNAKAEGFFKFIISIHYLGKMIEDYFENGDKLGVEITYIREQSALGTAGALSLIDPLPEIPFIVTNGDVLTTVKYGELIDFHTEKEATATMAVRIHEWQNPYGVVETDGDMITNYQEKPIYKTQINAGVYVFSSSAVSLLKKSSKCDMPEFFALVQKMSMKVIAFPIHERWIDVGAPEDLQRASELEINNQLKRINQ